MTATRSQTSRRPSPAFDDVTEYTTRTDRWECQFPATVSCRARGTQETSSSRWSQEAVEGPACSFRSSAFTSRAAVDGEDTSWQRAARAFDRGGLAHGAKTRTARAGSLTVFPEDRVSELPSDVSICSGVGPGGVRVEYEQDIADLQEPVSYDAPSKCPHAQLGDMLGGHGARKVKWSSIYSNTAESVTVRPLMARVPCMT